MAEPLQCPLCQRARPRLSKHHLIPKMCGGGPEHVVEICTDCHDAIHKMFSNKDLERKFHSLPALLGDERFSKHVAWLSKQSEARRFKSRRAKRR